MSWYVVKINQGFLCKLLNDFTKKRLGGWSSKLRIDLIRQDTKLPLLTAIRMAKGWMKRQSFMDEYVWETIEKKKLVI